MLEPAEIANFLTAFAELATRLSADSLAIYFDLQLPLLSAAGEFEAGRRRTRIRVTWEGKTDSFGSQLPSLRAAPLSVSGSLWRSTTIATVVPMQPAPWHCARRSHGHSGV